MQQPGPRGCAGYASLHLFNSIWWTLHLQKIFSRHGSEQVKHYSTEYYCFTLWGPKWWRNYTHKSSLVTAGGSSRGREQWHQTKNYEFMSSCNQTVCECVEYVCRPVASCIHPKKKKKYWSHLFIPLRHIRGADREKSKPARLCWITAVEVSPSRA